MSPSPPRPPCWPSWLLRLSATADELLEKAACVEHGSLLSVADELVRPRRQRSGRAGVRATTVCRHSIMPRTALSGARGLGPAGRRRLVDRADERVRRRARPGARSRPSPRTPPARTPASARVEEIRPPITAMRHRRAELAAGAERQRRRHHAADHRDGGHDDRARALAAGVDDGLGSRVTPRAISSTAKSTSMMAFLVTMPISIRMPIDDRQAQRLAGDGAAPRWRRRSRAAARTGW